MTSCSALASLEPVAPERAPVLQNLFELYAHDFSEHVPLAMQESGRFDVALSDCWWTAPGHFPFFLRSDGKLAGFALVRTGSRVTGARDVMDLAEFFVLRGARRKGVGARAVRALLAAFPGRWEVRVRLTNVAARAFWARALQEAAGGRLQVSPYTPSDGIAWEVFLLDTPA